jgi:hypothetical protein
MEVFDLSNQSTAPRFYSVAPSSSEKPTENRELATDHWFFFNVLVHSCFEGTKSGRAACIFPIAPRALPTAGFQV